MNVFNDRMACGPSGTSPRPLIGPLSVCTTATGVQVDKRIKIALCIV